MKIKTANVIVELCPEILKSVTQLIPEFKAMFRFKDLAPNKKGTARKIELYALLHHVGVQILRKGMSANEDALVKEINKHRAFRAKSKSEEEQKRLETYRDRLMIKKLKGIDLKLKDVDFDVYIEVQKVGAMSPATKTTTSCRTSA